MDSIKNYSLQEFLKQSPKVIEDYLNVLKHLEEGKLKTQLADLTLREVELLKKSIDDEDEIINVVSIVEKLSEEQVLKLKILEFFPLVKAIRSQLEKLIAREENNLTPKFPDEKFELVEGGKRLQRFGIWNVVNSLAGGDILKFDAILNLKYDKVFTKLLLDKELNDIQHEISKRNKQY
ncbi:hypothetical protein [Leeuwenhoekiella sp. NPDC079379]|uniref:hypothetical protein n=1 Tax=Leeuwenhoekiella sp. NPDC079379 TaxID=3364122 RepID=UPI0037CA5FCB